MEEQRWRVTLSRWGSGAMLQVTKVELNDMEVRCTAASLHQQAGQSLQLQLAVMPRNLEIVFEEDEQ
jgi:hypothetical protein